MTDAAKSQILSRHRAGAGARSVRGWLLLAGFASCVLAAACSPSTSHDDSGEPQTRAGAESGGGSTPGGGGSTPGGGGNSSGSTQAGASFGGGGSGFVCPPTVSQPASAAGCPASPYNDWTATCDLDSEKVCAYALSTQLICPPNMLSYRRCCGGKWISSGFGAPPPPCSNTAGGAAGAGGAP